MIIIDLMSRKCIIWPFFAVWLYEMAGGTERFATTSAIRARLVGLVRFRLVHDAFGGFQPAFAE
jgi:hypothetical protein